MIVVLAGGVGAARFLEGLLQVRHPEEIFVIGNTGDDRTFYGLHVSPDLDIVLYTLAGIVNPSQGWGINHDTFITMKQLTLLGNESWFKLGDRDLATHIHRTQLLKQGKPLSEVTLELVKKFHLRIQLVPMTNDISPTYIYTPHGAIHFEEYFVKYQSSCPVLNILFPNASKARPTPGILEALATAEAIIIAPSNPLVSIGSILSIPGIKQSLQQAKCKKIAISPIINGQPIKGPADKLMKAKNIEVSALGVAKYYKDIINMIVIDSLDGALKQNIENLGISVITTNTIMSNLSTKTALAKSVLAAVGLV